MLIPVVTLVLVVAAAAGAFLYLFRRRAQADQPAPVSLERRLGPTRPPLQPDQANRTLEYPRRRRRSSSTPIPELPPDPWGLEPDRSVAPFLSPPKSQPSHPEEKGGRAAQQRP